MQNSATRNVAPASTIGLALLAAASIAHPAGAAISIVGGGLGRDCFMAAELKRETRTSLGTCTRALEESLSRKDRAATHVNRGIIYMQARNLDMAMRDYAEAIRMEPSLAEAHVNLGIALLHRGGHDREAIASLTRGIDMKPARPEVALYTRAVAYEMVGDAKAAFEDYSAAAAARPDWNEPAEQLKRFQVERKRVGSG